MRARVFLWSTPGLASMKHFAILSSNTYEYSRGVFFHLGIHVLDYIVLINSYKRMSWVITMTKEQHSVIDY